MSDSFTKQNWLDLMDAVSVASEDLRYRADELNEDYTDADRDEMTAKADRLDALFPEIVKEAFRGGIRQRSGLE